MKAVKVIGAAILTIFLLFLSRAITVTRPVELISSAGGLEIKHTSVPKIINGSPDLIPVTINNPDNRPIRVDLKWVPVKRNLPDFSEMHAIPMTPVDSNPNRYAARMPMRDKGTIIFYFIEIRDINGDIITTVPEDTDNPLKLKYMGSPPAWVVLPHVLFMFAAVFFASLAFFASIRVISGHETALHSMAWNFLLAGAAVFLGGGPFGWAMNYYAFGPVWEAIPFGWDFTDNKTFVVFLYLLFLIFSMPAAFKKDSSGKNNFPPKTLGWLGFIGYFLVLTIYIIPHSIQFSVPVTALFSYGLTILIVGLYIIGVVRKGRWNNPA